MLNNIVDKQKIKYIFFIKKNFEHFFHISLIKCNILFFIYIFYSRIFMILIFIVIIRVKIFRIYNIYILL